MYFGSLFCIIIFFMICGIAILNERLGSPNDKSKTKMNAYIVITLIFIVILFIILYEYFDFMQNGCNACINLS